MLSIVKRLVISMALPVNSITGWSASREATLRTYVAVGFIPTCAPDAGHRFRLGLRLRHLMAGCTGKQPDRHKHYRKPQNKARLHHKVILQLKLGIMGSRAISFQDSFTAS